MLLSSDALIQQLADLVKVWRDEELVCLRRGERTQAAKARISAAVLETFQRDLVAQVAERAA